MPGCWNMNVCFTSRKSDIRMLPSPNEEVQMKLALLITICLSALLSAQAQAPVRNQSPAQPAAKPYTPARLPNGQPEITHGIWNRRGVGGLDNGALEAQDHRPPNPLDPTPVNPLSVSAREDGLNNVDRGFLDQFSERVAKNQPEGQRRNPARERRQMGIAEPGRILPWKPEADSARRAFLLTTNPT